MAVVRVQARDQQGNWAALAQLDHSEAQGYIDSLRSDHFLNTVEEYMRADAIKKGKDPETTKAVHLRKIRHDPAAFRIVPAWVEGDSIAIDLKKQNEAQLGVSPS